MSEGCRQDVGYSFSSYRKCGKPAGFGAGGNFCEQHRWQYPGETEPVIGSFWKVTHGDVVEAPYIKRTAKTYTNRRGNTSHLKTSYEQVYDTREEAIEVARERTINAVERAEETLARARKHAAAFIEKYGDGS